MGNWRAGYTIPDAIKHRNDLDKNLSSAKPREGQSTVCETTRGPQGCQYCEQGKIVKYSDYAGIIIQ